MTKAPSLPRIPGWIMAQLPTSIRRSVVPVGEQKMHLMELGSGYPVLMLHGNPTWGFLYRRILPYLENSNIRILLPDLIGLGFSSRVPQHSLAAHAGWVGALLDHLHLQELVFVGQDWGGPIGLRALADRPALLRGLVLLNTAVTPPRPGFRPTAFHRFSQLPVISNLVFRLGGFPQTILHRVQGDPSSIRGNVARAYRYPLRRLSLNQAPLAMARMVPDSLHHPSNPDLQRVEDFVGSFTGPAALIWGMRDPILGRLLARTARLLPQASVHETTGGHFVQEEEPELIATTILDIVNQLRG